MNREIIHGTLDPTLVPEMQGHAFDKLNEFVEGIRLEKERIALENTGIAPDQETIDESLTSEPVIDDEATLQDEVPVETDETSDTSGHVNSDDESSSDTEDGIDPKIDDEEVSLSDEAREALEQHLPQVPEHLVILIRPSEMRHNPGDTFGRARPEVIEAAQKNFDNLAKADNEIKLLSESLPEYIEKLAIEFSETAPLECTNNPVEARLREDSENNGTIHLNMLITERSYKANFGSLYEKLLNVDLNSIRTMFEEGNVPESLSDAIQRSRQILVRKHQERGTSDYMRNRPDFQMRFDVNVAEDYIVWLTYNMYKEAMKSSIGVIMQRKTNESALGEIEPERRQFLGGFRSRKRTAIPDFDDGFTTPEQKLEQKQNRLDNMKATLVEAQELVEGSLLDKLKAAMNEVSSSAREYNTQDSLRVYFEADEVIATREVMQYLGARPRLDWIKIVDPLTNEHINYGLRGSVEGTKQGLDEPDIIYSLLDRSDVYKALTLPQPDGRISIFGMMMPTAEDEAFEGAIIYELFLDGPEMRASGNAPTPAEVIFRRITQKTAHNVRDSWDDIEAMFGLQRISNQDVKELFGFISGVQQQFLQKSLEARLVQVIEIQKKLRETAQLPGLGLPKVLEIGIGQ
jgi:hypothetical protein